MRTLTLRGLLVGILALVSPALLGAQPVVNRCGDTVPVEQRTGPMVVIVPGIDRSSKDWRDMLEYFRSDRSLGIADSPFYCFDHGVGAMSRRNLRDLSRDLAASVDTEWQMLGANREVIIVAHSAGALIARAAYLIAARHFAGENTDEQLWHRHVTRFVLFAGVGRGVPRSAPIRAADMLVQQITPIGFDALVGQQLLRGSPFITNLRLSSIADLTEDTTDHARPLFVQLLGTHDGIVKQDDNIDLCVMDRVIQLAVPLATHRDIIQVRGTLNDADRRARVREAFTIQAPHDPGTSTDGRCRTYPTDTLPVVLMLHGIRSNPWAWQGGIADYLVSDSVPRDHIFRPNYGYFTLLDFVHRHSRDAEIPVLLDELVEIRTRYPNAPINVVAHSFGTYILAHALESTPAFRIRRVLLVGSMLPEDFPWDEIVRRGQAQTVYSQSGASDVPVSLAATAVSGFPFSNVGAGGTRGFMGTSVVRCDFVPGGHSAPFEDTSRVVHMSAFLAQREASPCATDATLQPSTKLQVTSRLAPGVGIAAAAAIAFVGGKYIADGRNPPARWRRTGQVGLSFFGARYLLSIF